MAFGCTASDTAGSVLGSAESGSSLQARWLRRGYKITSGCSITTSFIIQVSGITQPVVVRDDEPQEMGVDNVCVFL